MNKPSKYRDIFGWFNYETTYDMNDLKEDLKKESLDDYATTN